MKKAGNKHRLLCSILLFASFVCSVSFAQTPLNIQSMFLGNVITETSEFGSFVLPLAVAAYNVISPSTVISLTTQNPCQVKADLLANQVDIALTTCPLTIIESMYNPDIQQFPFAGVPVVPIFNIVGVSGLSFSLNTLAQIFAGSITNWNHSQIQVENPSLFMLLPNVSITVVLPSSMPNESQPISDSTLAFTTTMSASWSNFSQYVQPSVQPLWPLARYASVLPVSDPSIAVLAAVNSIGYCSVTSASIMGNTVGNIFVSSSLPPISVSAASVETAVSATSIIQIQMVASLSTANNITLDLNNSPAVQSWPIVATQYLQYNMQYSRSTCLARTATAELLLWLFESEPFTYLLEEAGGMSFPSIVLEEMNVNQRISLNLMCRGESAIPQVSADGIITSGDPRSSNINSLLLEAYNLQTEQGDSGYQYVWQANPSQLALDLLLSSEVSMALVFAEALDQNLWTEVVNSAVYANFPAYLFAMQFVYNVQIGINIALPQGTKLQLPMEVLTGVLVGSITSWSDPSILAFNPILAQVIGNSTVLLPINSIFACNSFQTNSQGAFITGILGSYTPQLSELINIILSSQLDICSMPLTDIISELDVAFNFSSSANAVVTTTDETAIGPIVAVTYGSFGYQQYIPGSNPNVGSIDIIINGVPIAPSPSTMLACTEGTFDSSTMLINSPSSQNNQCYPFTQTMYAVLNSNYSSTASGPGSCISGSLVYAFAAWAFNQTFSDTALDYTGIVRVARLPQNQQIIDYLFNSYPPTCDGQNLLQSQAILYQVNAALVPIASTLAAIGMLSVGAVVLFLTYQTNFIISSSKTLLLTASGLGMVLLFAALVPLSNNATSSSCSALMWLTNLGYTLLFVPMYLKIMRVYIVYGGGALGLKAQDMKASTLYKWFALAVLTDFIVLIIWQSVSPFAPLTYTGFTGTTEITYNQCGQPANGMGFVYAIGTIKIMFLLICALVAFTVHRVATTHNDHKYISIAIYNASIALALCVPIALIASVNGDGLIVLLLICFLWINVVALLALYMPNVIAVLSNKNGDLDSKQTPVHDLDTAMSVSMKFAFTSIEAMTEYELEMYIMALGEQVAEIKSRMNFLGLHVTSEEKNENGNKDNEQSKLRPQTSAEVGSVRTSANEIVVHRRKTVTTLGPS